MAHVLTTGEVAKNLHVTVNTVKRWISEGRLEAFTTPGGHFRIMEEDFKRFLERYGPSSTPKRVLVVDDDPGGIRLIVDTLSTMGEGYIIDTATDGYDALIKIGELKPHLLILDIRMPHLDGIEVIKRIRKGTTTKDIKVIVVTAYPEDLQAIKNSIQGLFAKPLELNPFREKVKKVLGGK
ncbi:MAG: response regulator [Deltaproteobacteria bacterium]|nr:response regulator [Deltaproteobacteria bacterium]